MKLIRTVVGFLTPKGWLLAGLAALAVALLGWAYLSGRGDADDAHTAKAAKAEIRAGVGRETAATERALDTTAVDQNLKEWNHAAEQTPDAAPDDRELRRRCRQLWDDGQRNVAVCRGLAGPTQAQPAP